MMGDRVLVLHNKVAAVLVLHGAEFDSDVAGVGGQERVGLSAFFDLFVLNKCETQV